MIQVSVREVRERLSHLVDEVEKGRTVTITRRGCVVAQLVPPPPLQAGQFPDLTAFRNSIRIKPGTLKVTSVVRQLRDEGRF